MKVVPTAVRNNSIQPHLTPKKLKGFFPELDSSSKYTLS